MKLKQFRVKAFRCIHNTAWVPVSDTAALIGKNESGKTAILAALAHLNRNKPISADDICDDLVDAIKLEDRFVEGLFELTAAEREILAKELPEVTGLSQVLIFRTKDSSVVDYEFPGATFPKKFSSNVSGKPAFVAATKAFTERIREGIARMFETQGGRKLAPEAKELRSLFEAQTKSVTNELADYRKAEAQLGKLTELTLQHFKGNRTVLGSLGALKKAFQGIFFLNDRRWRTKQFFLTNLHPRLIYFPEYKVIDGIIDVQAFLQAPDAPEQRTDIGYQFQKAETIRNLFHLAGLDPKQLETLAKDPTRLNSELVRSSQRLTGMLSLTWKAKKIRVRLNYTNGKITVGVSDVFSDGSTKNEGLLDRRSAGFKWHFSFYVNFRAGIQQSAFKNAILLLDEPGLNLHPEQQAGLVDVIRDLSQTNQVLYTTHSPFMIYNFDRGTLLVVEFDPISKASRIQQNFWDGDWQTIRPVLHSIGDGMLLKVFKGAATLTAILAVEGISDQRYLVTLAELELQENEESRLGGCEPIPSGGHVSVRERAMHYFKRKKTVAALFDNEPDALAQAAELEKHFPTKAIIRIDVGKKEADIEDIFTEDDYLKAVNGFYAVKLRDAQNFAPITKRDIEKAAEAAGNVRIVKALEHIFLVHADDSWGAYNKLGVCNFFCEALLAGDLKLSVKSKERFEALFLQIRNAINHASVTRKQRRQS